LNKETKYYLNLEPGDKVLLENPGTCSEGQSQEISMDLSCHEEIFTMQFTKLKIPKLDDGR